MAVGDYSTTITLQSAVATAVNGALANIDGQTSILVEISGTYTNITANFEASVDNFTWSAVALLPVGSTTPGTLVAAATAVGFYRLTDCRGYRLFRARTTIGSVTGTMTVKVYGLALQPQGA